MVALRASRLLELILLLSALYSDPAAVERVTASGPGELAGYDISLQGSSLSKPRSRTTILITHRHLVKQTGCCLEEGPVLRCRLTGTKEGGRDRW